MGSKLTNFAESEFRSITVPVARRTPHLHAALSRKQYQVATHVHGAAGDASMCDLRRQSYRYSEHAVCVVKTSHHFTASPCTM